MLRAPTQSFDRRTAGPTGYSAAVFALQIMAIPVSWPECFAIMVKGDDTHLQGQSSDVILCCMQMHKQEGMQESKG